MSNIVLNYAHFSSRKLRYSDPRNLPNINGFINAAYEVGSNTGIILRQFIYNT